jgi:hypothetical protein
MTSAEARDEIFTMLKLDWELYAPPFNLPHQSIAPEIYWQGVEYTNTPPAGIPYAKALLIHTSGRQVALGPVGSRLYEYQGILYVQCFGPSGSGKSLTIAEGLATIAKDAFEGKASPNGIWFRNCHVVEIGPENGWFQMNAEAGFSYSEVK